MPIEQRRLWAQLAPYRAHLPPLHFYLVEYPQVVLDVLAPRTALLTTGADVLNPGGYASAVRQAAELLAQQQLG